MRGAQATTKSGAGERTRLGERESKRGIGRTRRSQGEGEKAKRGGGKGGINTARGSRSDGGVGEEEGKVVCVRDDGG